MKYNKFTRRLIAIVVTLICLTLALQISTIFNFSTAGSVFMGACATMIAVVASVEIRREDETE